MKKATQETLQTPQQTEKKLPKKLISFLVASFKYSQGSAGLQQLFFTWAINTKKISTREQVLLSTIDIEYLVKQITLPKMHFKVSADKILESILDQTKIIGNTKPDPEYDNKQMLLTILRNIIDRDYRYLISKRRPERPLTGRFMQKRFVDSPKDDRASHVRRYILQPKNVRDPIFKKLFQELNKTLHSLLKQEQDPESIEGHIKSNLLFIQRRWEVTHPGFKFFD